MRCSVVSAQVSRVAVENDRVKVLSVDVQPHAKTKLHQHKINRVMVYLQPGKQDIAYQDGKKVELTWLAGEPKWGPAGGMHIAEITTGQPVTIVEIKLKHPPNASTSLSGPLDPVTVDPARYYVEFENDQVRLVPVKIGPGKPPNCTGTGTRQTAS